jgi:hypothetical protein
MPTLIDGHNLLYAVLKYEEFADMNIDYLCQAISKYLKRIKEKGHIIFDGDMPLKPGQTRTNYPALKVSYCGIDTDADTIIIEKINASSAPKRITVISSDREIADAARLRKAKAIPSDQFWHLLMEKIQQRHRPAPEPREKRQGLTESETDLWMKKFGFKDNQA